MRAIRVMSVMAVVLLLSASSARADGYASFFTGVNFGGAAGRSLDQALDAGNRLTFGGAVGGMSAGIFGAELDIAYTHNFFGNQSPIGNNSLLTIMPSLVLGIPIGGQRGPGLRPYATAGLGMIKRDLDIGNVQVFDGNDFAYSLGAGVKGYFTTHVGVQADYRYFRNIESDESNNVVGIDFDAGTFNYSRGTVGVLFRF
ncbi:MAG TPA: porin family protein [Vicinamibacterales bacterium]|nr:porin family protein [Vicinamibacterales bacterium]